MFQKVAYFLNHRGFTIFALVAMTYLLGAQSDKYYKWSNPPENPSHNITSDGCGYYAYLPQFFIYKTKHFEFLNGIQKKYPGTKFLDGTSQKGTGYSDKYFIGTAICIAPFFWTAHQITRLSGGEADGYSSNYELFLEIAVIAYWLLGVLSLLALLRIYGISRISILFGIIGLTFATNLNFYIVYHASFSHVYTFGIVCFMLLQTKKYVDSGKGKYLVWIFFLLAMITIIRPTNLIVALIIPFFFDSFKAFIQSAGTIFKSRKLALSFGIMIFGFLIFLQFLNIKSQYGYWGFNAYSEEGFDFLFSPKIGEVLFGFRKGFFIYTPFMLVLFPSLYFLFKWNRYFFYGFLLTTAAFIYIMASWWCWYYGGSVGMRPMIDIYGILVIPVVLLFSRVKFVFRTALIVFMALTIKFNLVLNYQMMHSILHYAEMDKERFFKIFMQTGGRFEWIFHTDQPKFEMDKYEAHKKYWFSSKTENWVGFPSHEAIELNKGTYLKSLIYIPNEALDSSEIAVMVKYSMKIDNEKDIPKALLFGYRNQQREELSVNFIGVQIPALDEYYPITAPLYSSGKYGEYDSLEVILENGEGKGSIVNASCVFYKSKQ